LIEFYETGRRELYDLSSDPRESKNLIAQYPDESLRLVNELQVWRQEVGALMPTPNPEDMVEVHQVLLGAGTVLLEALANLDGLRPGPFWLSAAPLKVVGSDGAPVRAFGLQPRA